MRKRAIVFRWAGSEALSLAWLATLLIYIPAAAENLMPGSELDYPQWPPWNDCGLPHFPPYVCEIDSLAEGGSVIEVTSTFTQEYPCGDGFESLYCLLNHGTMTIPETGGYILSVRYRFMPDYVLPNNDLYILWPPHYFHIPIVTDWAEVNLNLWLEAGDLEYIPFNLIWRFDCTDEHPEPYGTLQLDYIRLEPDETVSGSNESWSTVKFNYGHD